jgi:hypothetical protein
MAIDYKRRNTKGTKKGKEIEEGQAAVLSFSASTERSDVNMLGAEGHSGQPRDAKDAEIRYI